MASERKIISTVTLGPARFNLYDSETKKYENFSTPIYCKILTYEDNAILQFDLTDYQSPDGKVNVVGMSQFLTAFKAISDPSSISVQFRPNDLYQLRLQVNKAIAVFERLSLESVSN